MKTRALGLALVGMLGGLAIAVRGARTGRLPSRPPPARASKPGCPATSATILPYDPASKVTVEKADGPRFRASRAGRSSAPASTRSSNVDKTVYVSDDGKWFFDGDTVAQPEPEAGARRPRDLAWLEARTLGPLPDAVEGDPRARRATPRA